MAIIYSLLFMVLPVVGHAQTAEESNILIYGDEVQVSSGVNVNDTIPPDKPIDVSIMVTHDNNKKVDANTFSLGDKPLKVDFVKTVPISSTSSLIISLYKTQLEPMKRGMHTLKPIKVKVGDKYYEALPLVIQVG